MRGYDITFVASGRRHAILFQAPASRWAASRDELQAFLAGFRPPLTAAGAAAVAAPRSRSIASRASTRTWRSASLRAASGWAST